MSYCNINSWKRRGIGNKPPGALLCMHMRGSAPFGITSRVVNAVLRNCQSKSRIFACSSSSVLPYSAGGMGRSAHALRPCHAGSDEPRQTGKWPVGLCSSSLQFQGIGWKGGGSGAGVDGAGVFMGHPALMTKCTGHPRAACEWPVTPGGLNKTPVLEAGPEAQIPPDQPARRCWMPFWGQSAGGGRACALGSAGNVIYQAG